MGYGGNGAACHDNASSPNGVIVVTTRNVEDLREMNVCNDCIGESYLSNLIEAEGRRRRCDYCSERSKAVVLEVLST